MGPFYFGLFCLKILLYYAFFSSLWITQIFATASVSGKPNSFSDEVFNFNRRTNGAPHIRTQLARAVVSLGHDVKGYAVRHFEVTRIPLVESSQTVVTETGPKLGFDSRFLSITVFFYTRGE